MISSYKINNISHKMRKDLKSTFKYILTRKQCIHWYAYLVADDSHKNDEQTRNIKFTNNKFHV